MPRPNISLAQSKMTKESCALGARRATMARKQKRLEKQMREMKVDQIRAAAAAVALCPARMVNPRTKVEEETNNFTILIWKIYEMSMAGNVRAMDLFFKLLFFEDPREGGPNININQTIDCMGGSGPRPVDRIETLRELKRALRAPITEAEEVELLAPDDAKFMQDTRTEIHRPMNRLEVH